MSPIQQMLLGVGAVAKSTYIDDVFSTFLYKGTGSALTINNGINMSGEGGMTWLKERDGSYSHRINDTERGANKQLYTNLTNAEATETTELTSFNNNGFSLGTSTSTNDSNNTYASWSFRKAPGFFDVVTYTGNGSNRTIAHSLGSVPGFMLIKRTDDSDNWFAYHCESENATTSYLKLNNNSASQADGSGVIWNSTAPTSTVFSIGTDGGVNDNGGTYVCYLFAGGESTAATARSVDFDGSNDLVDLARSSDLVFTGDFTFEGWFKPDTVSGNQGLWVLGAHDLAGGFEVYTKGKKVGVKNVSGEQFNSADLLSEGQWYHLALVRSGSAITLYLNGTSIDSYTDSSDYGSNNRTYFLIGASYGSGGTSDYFNGSQSNIRVLNGTALYTSSFRPPTTPLTNITNTKLLYCNNASVTAGTVLPASLTNQGCVASTDSPFDDPAAFVFGANEDQQAIKCGSYVGNASDDGPEIVLGFEPQYILLKAAESAEHWFVADCLRGIVTGGNDMRLIPDLSDGEYTNFDGFSLTPTGFKITTLNAVVNPDGEKVIYMAIRRPDGYVGKPPELGTDVFAMDTGTSNSDIPAFVSGFPLDYVFIKTPAGTGDWFTQSRLTGTNGLKINDNIAQYTDGDNTWDFQNGYYKGTADLSAFQAWMWKRHAGFDVVTYKGDLVVGRSLPHQLSVAPEMIWFKSRTVSDGWVVWHKGLGGGTNSQQKRMFLDTSGAEVSDTTYLNNTYPTSTHISLAANGYNNHSNSNYIAMLFASVDGISKVGSYVGNGSATARTITLGFQPRFVIIKHTGWTTDWYVLDTVRGWASGNDQILYLNVNNAQVGTNNIGAPTSTGFTLTSSATALNEDTSTYIYYAHA